MLRVWIGSFVVLGLSLQAAAGTLALVEQLKTELFQKNNACQGDPGTCLHDLKTGLNRIDRAQIYAFEQEKERLKMFVPTRRGWTDLDRQITRVTNSADFAQDTNGATFQCADPKLKSAHMEISSFAEDGQYRLRTEPGLAFLISLRNAGDEITPDACAWEVTEEQGLGACAAPNAFAGERLVANPHCRKLHARCQPQTSENILNISLCQDANCRRLRPTSSFAAQVSLSGSSRLPGPLLENLYTVQDKVISLFVLKTCCGDAQCISDVKTRGVTLLAAPSNAAPLLSAPEILPPEPAEEREL